MPANAHTSKKFTCMCFEKSEVISAEKKIKMVVVVCSIYPPDSWENVRR